MTSYPTRTYEDVREALLARREIALLDVREEDPHAQSHPLFAANFPLSKIELEAYTRLPRRDVPIVLLDAGEGFAQRAADVLDRTRLHAGRVARGRARRLDSTPAAKCSAT